MAASNRARWDPGPRARPSLTCVAVKCPYPLISANSSGVPASAPWPSMPMQGSGKAFVAVTLGAATVA
ncbi:hypothetical protein [Streptomyces chrestomyceticus]|uniref:hypothetical protein n=1 Tax=Streptomyces chrestomyceticus TaxID=68185 RepID=UPI00340DBC85